MVLNSEGLPLILPARSRRLLAVLLALPLMSCSTHQAVVKAPEVLPVRVAYIVDLPGNRASQWAPVALEKALDRELELRNLLPSLAKSPAHLAAFQPKATGQRLRALSGAEGPVLLVECTVEFYALIEGRYRWTVASRLSWSGDGSSMTLVDESVLVPVFLLFEHEREEKALEQAIPVLQRRLGRLLDEVLQARLAGEPGAERREVPVEKGLGAPASDVVYLAMVDRYANGDAENDGVVDLSDPQARHGGDLAGLIHHVDDLARLGVGTLQITPVYTARTTPYDGNGAYHGYWVEDFRSLDPHFGSPGELRLLGAELRRRNMGLMLDLVTNHVAPASTLVEDHPDWFHDHGAISDWGDAQEVEVGDVHGLPDLDQSKPEVATMLLQSVRAWVRDYEPQALRVDAVRHLPLGFVAQLVEAAHEVDPQVKVYGEIFDGKTAVVAQAVKDTGLDGVYDFPLHYALLDAACKGGPLWRVASVLSAARLYPEGTERITFLDNHDTERVATACGGGLGRVRRGLELLTLLPGRPSITWGTELPLYGAGEPETRADMRFDVQPLAPFIGDLLRRRSQHPSLRGGETRFLVADGEHLLMLREGDTEWALLAVNWGTEAWTATLPEGMVESLGGAPPLEVAPEAVGVTFLPAQPGTSVSLEDWPRVSFEVEATLPAGVDALVVVGSAPELGAWDPQRGLRLMADGPGRWNGKVSLPAWSGSTWKLAFLGPGEVQWQDIPDQFLLLQNAELRVRAEWGS